MRSAILSIVNLPQNYCGSLSIVLNDEDIAIVARNVIFLLVFFVEDDPFQAAEHVIHIWYSTLVTDTCYSMLLRKVKPLVQEVCDRISQRPGLANIGKTWGFGERSLRVVLTRDNWFLLLSYFDVPSGLEGASADRVRKRFTLAPERVDITEERMVLRTSSGRLGTHKFLRDGMLLPFSQSREGYAIPNP